MTRDKNDLCGLTNIKNEIIIPCMFKSIKIIKLLNNIYLINNKHLLNRQHKILLYNKKKIYEI